MRRLFVSVGLIAAVILALAWHRHAVAMARLEGYSLALDRCREIITMKP